MLANSSVPREDDLLLSFPANICMLEGLFLWMCATRRYSVPVLARIVVFEVSPLPLKKRCSSCVVEDEAAVIVSTLKVDAASVVPSSDCVSSSLYPSSIVVKIAANVIEILSSRSRSP